MEIASDSILHRLRNAPCSVVYYILCKMGSPLIVNNTIIEGGQPMVLEHDWLRRLWEVSQTGGHISLEEAPLRGSGTVVVVAPHPDDPESSAVFQRMLFKGGWSVRWVVLTSASSGVRDEFVGPDVEAKASIRRAEQTESARLFGLDEGGPIFLNLPETPQGDLDDNAGSYSSTGQMLDVVQPRIIILPWGQDSNPTHRLVYEWFERWVGTYSFPLAAFLCEDPKSLNFTPNLSVEFGEPTAQWKASLLECHRSQTERNIATRGHTFSERILSVNRKNACQENVAYAERFCVRFYAATESLVLDL